MKHRLSVSPVHTPGLCGSHTAGAVGLLLSQLHSSCLSVPQDPDPGGSRGQPDNPGGGRADGKYSFPSWPGVVGGEQPKVLVPLHTQHCQGTVGLQAQGQGSSCKAGKAVWGRASCEHSWICYRQRQQQPAHRHSAPPAVSRVAGEGTGTPACACWRDMGKPQGFPACPLCPQSCSSSR